MNITSPSGSVPITDPSLTATPATLVISRYRFFEGPNLSLAPAASLNAEPLTPIQATVSG